jgi:response regulator RpfG family c-di-GMP phosphodiesterase
MANSTRTQKARHAASSVGSNEYVRRLIEDEELRNSIREAYDAGRSAYGRLQKQKRPATALMDDKKVHRELREAAESLREASDRLRGREEKKGSTLGKLLLLGIIGAAAALILSEDLRKAVLDRLFGAEEEFEYTSTTAPANGGPDS